MLGAGLRLQALAEENRHKNLKRGLGGHVVVESLPLTACFAKDSKLMEPVDVNVEGLEAILAQSPPQGRHDLVEVPLALLSDILRLFSPHAVLVSREWLTEVTRCASTARAGELPVERDDLKTTKNPGKKTFASANAKRGSTSKKMLSFPGDGPSEASGDGVRSFGDKKTGSSNVDGPSEASDGGSQFDSFDAGSSDDDDDDPSEASDDSGIGARVVKQTTPVTQKIIPTGKSRTDTRAEKKRGAASKTPATVPRRASPRSKVISTKQAEQTKEEQTAKVLEVMLETARAGLELAKATLVEDNIRTGRAIEKSLLLDPAVNDDSHFEKAKNARIAQLKTKIVYSRLQVLCREHGVSTLSESGDSMRSKLAEKWTFEAQQNSGATSAGVLVPVTVLPTVGDLKEFALGKKLVELRDRTDQNMDKARQGIRGLAAVVAMTHSFLFSIKP